MQLNFMKFRDRIEMALVKLSGNDKFIHDQLKGFENKDTTKCFVLMSGGIDSTTALFLAAQKYIEVYAVDYDYKNRPAIETRRVEKICHLANVKRITLKYPLVYSKDFREINLSESNGFYYITCAILAKKFLEKNLKSKILIFAGQIKSDWLISKTKNGTEYINEASPSAYRQINKLIRLDVSNRVKVITPFIFMNKDDVVKLALDLKVPLFETWSCPYSNEIPCGKCQQCKERNESFKKFNLV